MALLRNDDERGATPQGGEQPPVERSSPFKGATGLRRIWNALWYSIDGLRSCYVHESAFRQEVLLAALLLPAAFLVDGSLTQKAILVAAVVLVLIVELLNSAVESTVDRISLTSHDLAKRAKDAGSAAVLLSLLLCAAVWVIVLVDVYA